MPDSPERQPLLMTVPCVVLPANIVLPEVDPPSEVDPALRRASVLRSGRRRVLRAWVALDEPAAVRLRMVCDGTQVAERRWVFVPAGPRVLRLRLPDEVPVGHAEVLLELTSADGRTRRATWRLSVPGIAPGLGSRTRWWPAGAHRALTRTTARPQARPSRFSA